MRKRYLIVVLFIMSIIAVSRSYSQPVVSWTARFNGLLDSMDIAKDIAIDNSGDVYVTGYSRYLAGLLTDIVTIKYRGSDGAEIWRAEYGGLLWDEGNKIVLDNNNNVYVTGFSYGLLTTSDYVTIKYNSAGVQQWARTYDRQLLFDEAKSIAVDGNGNVYVTGYTTTLLSLKDFTTIKYNSAGVQQWVAVYSGPVLRDDIAYDLALDGNNNIFVTGSRISFILLGTEDYATIKYNNNGVQQWAVFYDGPAHDRDIAYAIVVDNSNNPIITGESAGLGTGSGTNSDYATIKYSNNNGTQLWVDTYNGTGNGEDRPYAIVVDNSDNVIVTGESMSSGADLDYATVKYSSGGSQQWASGYNGTGNSEDRPYAIVVDNSDNVYVTGEATVPGSGLDYATVKYDQSGTEQWSVLYNGTGNNEDRPYAIVVDNADNVYVTGSSRRGSLLGSEDYLTIKYSPSPLPVILLSFTFNKQKNDVVLTWETAIEINNSGFRVERRKTGDNEWSNLGFVPGNGTTNEPKTYTFLDKRINTGKYTYRLKQMDYNGNFEYFMLGSEVTIGNPEAFDLSQNYPNPSNPMSRIDFQLPAAGKVTIKVYNILGVEISTLLNEHREAGYYAVDFDGTNFPSGIYFYTIWAGDYIETKKLVLVK